MTAVATPENDKRAGTTSAKPLADQLARAEKRRAVFFAQYRAKLANVRGLLGSIGSAGSVGSTDDDRLTALKRQLLARLEDSDRPSDDVRKHVVESNSPSP